MRDQILITGIGGPAGKSAVSYFKEKGFYIIGTDIKDVDVRVDSFHIVPLATEDSYMEDLLDIIKRKEPGLFVPTVTEELLKVSRLKKKIERSGCSVFISPPYAVEIANNKFKTAEFFSRNGVPVPLTVSGAEPGDVILKKIGLPMLSKPCFGRGGRGVTLYRAPSHVHSGRRKDIVFQEFIDGDEFDVNLFAGKGGEALCGVVLKKTALKEGIVGNALKVERTERHDLLELSMKASRALKMEGPLDFDIRIRNDGVPVLLEVNARLGGNVLNAREVLDSLLASFFKQRAAIV